MKKITCLAIAMMILSVLSTTVVSVKVSNSNSESHGIIEINGNNNFTEENGVVAGDGTPEEPYIISNWKIQARITTGITIKNTDKYFIIDNCDVSSKGMLNQSGIFLINASNGKVVDSSFSDCKFGLGVISSKNTIVEKCEFTGCEMGLTLNGCPTQDTPTTMNNTIRKCNFYDNSNGIYLCCLPNSYNNLIEYCNFYENTRGIKFDHLVNYVLVTKCNFTDNGVGLRLVSNSNDDYITGNIFSGNHISAWSFCKGYWDNGEVYGGNYWDDYNGTGPYEIMGTTNEVDKYPLLSEESNEQIISFFYCPKIAFVEKDVKFDASLSYPQKQITNYSWDFGDGEESFGKIVNHKFESDGEYNVTCNITDGVKFDEFSKKILIVNLSNQKITVNNSDNIQDAINIAKPGSTVFIKNGVYYENITIETPFINIVGESKESTVINGSFSGDVISIHADCVNISNLKIQGSEDEFAGIKIGKYEYITDAVGCKINDTIIQNNYYGIIAQGTNKLELTNNQILFNRDTGIFLDKTHSCIVKNNNITGNEWFGIKNGWGSNWNLFEENLISKGNYGIDQYHSNYVKIIRNEITENLHGIKIYASISPKINYNNIFKNKRSGIETIGPFTINDYKNNWYGSIFGPGSALGIFGDSVIYKNDDVSKIGLKSIVFRYVSCYPWEKQKISISLP